MNEPETGKGAQARVKIDGAKEIIVYRKGKPEVILVDTLNLNLESCEGVFVTTK